MAAGHWAVPGRGPAATTFLALSLPPRNQSGSYGRVMKTAADKRTEAELHRQLMLIEAMLREGRSEREIVAALEDR